MQAESFVEGHPVGDFQLAAEVLYQRYHCSPMEELVVDEVFEKKEMRLARKLFRRWESDQHEFLELMQIRD
jgi:hypothetical protein